MLDAIKVEYKALVQNNMWTLVSPLVDDKIIGYKWVFRNKYNANGSLQRRKARLVAKGFHLTFGLHYNDTFSLVIKHSTIRVVLILVVANK